MPSERWTQRHLEAALRRRELMDTSEQVIRIRTTLQNADKQRLIDAMVELAGEQRPVLRRLQARFPENRPLGELVKSTRQAIADATAFDKLRINSNFEYDCEAYETVAANLLELVERGEYALAMELAIELMREGSDQVSNSDEGVMVECIEECFRPLIDSLKKSDVLPATIVTWCDQMLRADCTGFIVERDLQKLRLDFR